tara:strand:- start:45 stop:224 length:180 start_codon:yes stop_codon:yes gene_type:complete
MQIIAIGDERFMTLGVVSVDCGYNTEELKTMWRLADTILRNENKWYICSKLIEAEFKDI